MAVTKLATFLFWTSGLLLLAPSAVALEKSVVTLSVSKQNTDTKTPWLKQQVKNETHLGTLVGPNQIITSAFAVADATYLSMSKFGDTRKYELEVVKVDYEVNLALLKAKDPSAVESLQQIALGPDLSVNAGVTLYKPRDRYQLKQFSAKLIEVGVFTAVTSGYGVISYLLKVQQSGLGWSEPVVFQGKLVAMSTGQDRNSVHAIPAGMIRHFLEDIAGKAYRGFPTGGFVFRSLEDPNVRKLLQAESITGGVQIVSVLPGGPLVDIIQPDDVLFELQGKTLSEHGYYQHPKWGKIQLKYILNQMYGGDEIKFKVLRKGKPVELTGKVIQFDSNERSIPYYSYGQSEPHVIFGGLVFQRLSRDYLKGFGTDWSRLAPYHFLFKWHYENDLLTNPGQQVVILNRILADEFNRGYDKIRNEVIDTINSVKIKSLADVRKALDQPVTKDGAQYAVIQLAYGGGQIVLGYKGLQGAHERLAQTYQIPDNQSFFTHAH